MIILKKVFGPKPLPPMRTVIIIYIHTYTYMYTSKPTGNDPLRDKDALKEPPTAQSRALLRPDQTSFIHS